MKKIRKNMYVSVKKYFNKFILRFRCIFYNKQLFLNPQFCNYLLMTFSRYYYYYFENYEHKISHDLRISTRA